MLIAGLAGAGIAIAVSWAKIKRLFKKNKAADAPTDIDKDEDDEQPDA